MKFKSFKIVKICLMNKIKCLAERRIRIQICTCDPIADPGGFRYRIF
jgi:hypothetical protein